MLFQVDSLCLRGTFIVSELLALPETCLCCSKTRRHLHALTRARGHVRATCRVHQSMCELCVPTKCRLSGCLGLTRGWHLLMKGLTASTSHLFRRVVLMLATYQWSSNSDQSTTKYRDSVITKQSLQWRSPFPVRISAETPIALTLVA